MKQTKRGFALVLVLLLVVSCFAGCGKEKAERDEALFGTWVHTQPIPAAGIEVAMEMHLELNKDGTVKMFVPDESIRDMCNSAYDQVYGEYSEEEVQAALKEQGFASKDECIDAFYESFKESVDGGSIEGFWKSGDGKLIIFETEEEYKEGKPTEDNVDSYTLSDDGKTLTVHADGTDIDFKKR